MYFRVFLLRFGCEEKSGVFKLFILNNNKKSQRFCPLLFSFYKRNQFRCMPIMECISVYKTILHKYIEAWFVLMTVCAFLSWYLSKVVKMFPSLLAYIYFLYLFFLHSDAEQLFQFWSVGGATLLRQNPFLVDRDQVFPKPACQSVSQQTLWHVHWWART